MMLRIICADIYNDVAHYWFDLEIPWPPADREIGPLFRTWILALETPANVCAKAGASYENARFSGSKLVTCRRAPKWFAIAQS